MPKNLTTNDTLIIITGYNDFYKSNRNLFDFVSRFDRYTKGKISYLELNDINGNQLRPYKMCSKIMDIINTKSCQYSKNNLMFETD